MRTLDLEALRIFHAVAQTGGVTRAAAKLHRVQSSVTTRVKQLEASLGTPLFTRARSRMELTPEGHVLMGYAEEMLRLSSEAQAAVQGGSPRGTFRLGTLESTAAARLPEVLSRYHRAYPDVHIELATGTSGALVSRLRALELDAVLVAEPFTAEGLEWQPAFEEELVVVAAKGGPPIRRARDIGGRTVIAFAAGCSYRRRLEEWLGRDSVVPAHVMEFASYHAIVACVAAGTGIAIVPRSVLALSPARREVQACALPAKSGRARTLLAWRPGTRLPALEALRQQLRA